MKLLKHDRYCFYIAFIKNLAISSATVFYYIRMLFVLNASLDTRRKVVFFHRVTVDRSVSI